MTFHEQKCLPFGQTLKSPVKFHLEDMFSPMNLPTVNQNIKNVAKTPSTDDVNNVSNVSKAHSPKNTNHSNTDIAFIMTTGVMIK